MIKLEIPSEISIPLFRTVWVNLFFASTTVIIEPATDSTVGSPRSLRDPTELVDSLWEPIGSLGWPSKNLVLALLTFIVVVIDSGR